MHISWIEHLEPETESRIKLWKVDKINLLINEGMSFMFSPNHAILYAHIRANIAVNPKTDIAFISLDKKMVTCPKSLKNSSLSKLVRCVSSRNPKKQVVSFRVLLQSSLC